MKLEPYSKWRPRLLPIIEQAAQNNRHTFASSVDNALLSGKAFLFINHEGFIALEPYDGDRVHIVFAFSYTSGCTARYHREVEALSLRIGAKYVTFDTAIKGGFLSLVKKLGYQEIKRDSHVVTFQKEIS